MQKLTRLGYAALLGLLILSAIFYQERALFTDIAYQTFLMINDGGLQVQVYRFGAGVVQLLPLLALKLEAPLWAISFCYSISFPLLYLLFYWVIVRMLRQPLMGWALVLLFTLMVYDGFYWPSSEQQQGLAFLLVFWAFVLRFPALDRWWMPLVAAVGIVALAFYHPLVFIPFFFLWGYLGWLKPELRTGRFLGLALLMIVVLALKSQLAANWYDSGKYGAFFSNLVQDFPNYFQYPSHRKFLINSLYYWYGFPIALLPLTAFYVAKKRWLPLAWVWAFCLGHLFLLHIGSPESRYRFYAEVNYLPLTIYVVVPLLLEWAFPRWDKSDNLRDGSLAATRRRGVNISGASNHQAPVPKRFERGPWLFYLFLSIIVLRLLTIALHHRPFTARVNWLATQMESAPSTTNRYVLPLDQAPMDTLLMEWGVAYESLLLSAMEHPDSAKTILILPDTGRYPDLFRSDTAFYSGLKAHDLEELNPAYFRLGKKRYVTLE